jgi:antitoxin component HigA of HigAB toxin-antitoxin module
MVTEAEYQQALAEIRHLVEGEPDRTSPEGQRLDILAALAETYEAPQSALSLLDINSR